MHNLIFYGSYLSFPFLAFLIFIFLKYRKQIFGNKLFLLAFIFFTFLSLIFIYSRFIERKMILIKETEIEVGFSAKIVVISDIHLGVYKNVDFLHRVVDKINTIENIDAVLIPGDFVYYSGPDLDLLFSPLKDIKVPVYAVLGNHDSEHPGPPIQEELVSALRNNGVHYLDNQNEVIEGLGITVLGLSDKWADADDILKIDEFSEEDNLIVITHNPDTVLKYTNSIPDITITGHTHAGQIRLPFIYKYAIPCEGDFDIGLYEKNFGKVFVSPGLGETALPMRLGIPPRIDLLKFY